MSSTGYGFGKAEALSALVQSAFIAGSGVFVVYEGVSRFISPRPVGDTGVGILVMAASTVITLGLIAFQKYVVKKTASLAVAAGQCPLSGRHCHQPVDHDQPDRGQTV